MLILTLTKSVLSQCWIWRFSTAITSTTQPWSL